MSGAHPHLLVNQLPIMASGLAALLAAWALRADGDDLWARSAALLLIVAGLSALVAYVTGSAAVQAIEGYPAPRTKRSRSITAER